VWGQTVDKSHPLILSHLGFCTTVANRKTERIFRRRKNFPTRLRSAAALRGHVLSASRSDDLRSFPSGSCSGRPTVESVYTPPSRRCCGFYRLWSIPKGRGLRPRYLHIQGVTKKKTPFVVTKKKPSFSVKNPGTRADSPLFLRNLFRSCQRDLKNGVFFFGTLQVGFFFM